MVETSSHLAVKKWTIFSRLGVDTVPNCSTAVFSRGGTGVFYMEIVCDIGLSRPTVCKYPNTDPFKYWRIGLTQAVPRMLLNLFGQLRAHEIGGSIGMSCQ